jgi:hypothetical protein
MYVCMYCALTLAVPTDITGAAYLPCQNYKALNAHKIFSNGIHQFLAIGLSPSDFRVGPYCQGQSFSPE